MKNQSIKKFNLDNSTAIITGGAGILGRRFSKVLLENGSNVAIFDINEKDIKETIIYLKKQTNNPNVIGLVCDLTCEKSIIASVKKVINVFGQINILVNNAATKTKRWKNFFENFENYKLSVWRDVMSVNIDSMFLMSREVGKHMVKNKIKGSIVQISSIYGLIAPDQEIYDGSMYKNHQINTPAVYSTSKAAVIGLSKYLSTYWGSSGIRVNTIIPGGVESGQNSKFNKNYSKKVPLKRMAKLDEIENALLFLTSDASSYVTGQSIIIDGGMSTW